ncbi:MAG TPA: hypothetical protein VMI31_01800 [Fimbriimonadaceae bacterium]|nr:hypothetical protein [Fimbriimonadaceae bacterium]
MIMTHKRKHEPTQPGNPRALTIRQHIHSRWSISRFADDDGRVAVLRHGQSAPFLATAENDVFCAKRVWGQNLEEGLFDKIERAFHAAVESILATGSVVDHRAVTAYLSIWRIRAQLAEQPPADTVLRGIKGSSLSKDEEEILEKKGYAYARPGGTMPGRFGAFIDAHRRHDMTMSRIEGVRWGVLHAKECEGLVCSDRPGNELYLPIAPRVVLVAGYRDLDIGAVSVDDLNDSSHRQARDFVFGHPNDVAALVARRDSLRTGP